MVGDLKRKWRKVMNPYVVLGVSPGEDPNVIRRRYRLLAGKWHPDRNPDSPLEAERKFKEIAEAYRVLSNRSYQDSWAKPQSPNPGYTKPNPYRRAKKTYWERLREDEGNPESQAKVVLYELGEGLQKKGFDRYQEFLRDGITTLEQCLEGRDLLDCCFLLAEEFEKRKMFAQALDHYRRVFWLQYRKPIMPYYRLETGERLLGLLNKVVSREEDPRKKLKVLKQGLHYARGKAELRRLMIRLSDVATELGDVLLAKKVGRAIARNGYSIKSLQVVKKGFMPAALVV